MAKGNSKNVANLLRLSGLIFAAGGSFHVLRYFLGWEFKVAAFELTLRGSLLIGVLAWALSAACFWNSRK
ncbi:MAG: hypothetical protein HYT89_04815 [Candidatus Omnitrophica bacterium]|nr:hypothetical protein [Candidatus Omnitrophota bacterium]